MNLRQSGTPMKLLLLLAGIIVVGGVAFLDYLTGPEISFSVFYLIPIMLGGWYGGRTVGLILAFASAFDWLLIEVSASTFSHPAIPYWNAGMRWVLYSIVIIALSRLEESVERETKLARMDSLTGAANGRTFHETIEHEVKRATRTGHPFSVAYMDLDNFKAVNDQKGHLVGDEVLRTVAETMKRNMRATDLVARLGGDEFAVFQPETNGEGAVASLSKLRDALLSAMKKKGWPVTVSIGAVTFLTPPNDPTELIRQADALLYEVKGSGKNNLKHKVVGQEE